MKSKSMKPITAEQARSLTVSANESLALKCIGDIYNSIVLTAQAGYNSLVYPLDNTRIDGVVIGAIIKELKKLGYKAEHSCGSDCRDSDSWNNLNISW